MLNLIFLWKLIECLSISITDNYSKIPRRLAVKRIVTLFAIAAIFGLVCVSSAFAQSSDIIDEIEQKPQDISTQVIRIEDKYATYHPKAKTVTMEIEYMPLTGEVYFHYVCIAASYDQGEAMNTAIAVLEDFAQEYQYRSYTHSRKDKSKYYKDAKGVRMAEYITNVVFVR